MNLDTPFHGNHPKYNDYVNMRIKALIDEGNLSLGEIRKLQDELKGHIVEAFDNFKKTDEKLNDYFKKGKHIH